MRSCLKPSPFHEPRHRGIRDDPALYTWEYVAISLLLNENDEVLRLIINSIRNDIVGCEF